MRKGIRLRWTPLAVDTLLELEETGTPQIAGRLIEEIADRLTKQPGIYREVEITAQGAQRRTKVRRLYLGRDLPYHVYFYYDKSTGIVEIIRILHVRQKPIER